MSAAFFIATAAFASIGVGIVYRFADGGPFGFMPDEVFEHRRFGSTLMIVGLVVLAALAFDKLVGTAL